MRNPVCLIVLSCVPLLSQTASRERLTLADAEQLAIRNHPRLQSARFQANALRAQVPQVKAALAPVLVGNLTGSAADNGSRLGAGGLNASSLFSRFGAGIGVSQTLYDFGRTNKLAESAALRADAQDVTVDAVRGELILQIRQAYLRVLETQRALQLGQQSLQSRQLIRRQVQAFTENQLRSTLDLQFAEVAVSEAETLLARLEGELEAANATLAAALGFIDERRFELEEVSQPVMLPLSVDSLVEEALNTRPELIARRRQQEAARQFAVSESRLTLPSVSTTGAFGFIPTGDPRLRSRYGGLGLNINIPVFNGRIFDARRQEAEARARSAGQDTRDLELRIAREVRTAYAEARNAQRRMSLAERQSQQSIHLFRLAQARYEAGLGNIVEVNQAELARFTAELGVEDARYGLLGATAVLDFAIGRLR